MSTRPTSRRASLRAWGLFVLLLVPVPAALRAERYGDWADPLPRPILVRRLCLEDRPMRFMVSLPEGARVCRDALADEDVTVGAKGLKLAFSWSLRDAEDAILAEWKDEGGRIASRWTTPVVVAEPYAASYPDKLRLLVEASFTPEDGPTRTSRARFDIPRIQDVTGPLVASHGDEERYPPFSARVRGRAADGVLTTHDRMVTPEGQAVVRSPFRAVVDDGRIVENGDEPPAMRGCLAVAWENLFDNSNAPFWGTREVAIERFCLVMRMQWDTANSHYLVGGADEPYFPVNELELPVGEGRTERVAMVDLGDTLKAFDQRSQPFGRGVVRVPLPYDRVGRIEVGFHAADAAWPKANTTTKWIGSWRVEDDIAPVILVSLMATRLRRSRPVFDTVDAVNRRWAKTPEPWILPDALPEPLAAAEPLVVKEDTPLECHVFTFENTRLERQALSLSVRAEGAVPAGSFGFRPSRQVATVERRLVVARSDFDPSVARTAPGDPPLLLFQEPGRYELLAESVDVNRNRRSLSLPLVVERLEVDVVTVEEEGRRR